MKKFILIILLSAVSLAGCKQKEQKLETGGRGQPAPDNLADARVIRPTTGQEADSNKKSIKAYVKNNIGSAELLISYYSPAVRNRVIWGGLVPFDQVWVTGAHSATSLEISKDFMIGDRPLPAGKYAVFTIPGKQEWTFILNSNWDQHLADEYDAADDMFRMTVKPDSLASMQERLMYQIEPTGSGEGRIIISWEKLKLVVPVRVP